jgi:hypothetical protein
VSKKRRMVRIEEGPTSRFVAPWTNEGPNSSSKQEQEQPEAVRSIRRKPARGETASQSVSVPAELMLQVRQGKAKEQRWDDGGGQDEGCLQWQTGEVSGPGMWLDLFVCFARKSQTWKPVP